MIPYESWQPKTADADLLQRCKKAIRTVVPDADVILYGSRARGDAKEDSDYDILVLMDRPVTAALREQLISAIYPLELESEALLTLIPYNRDLWNSKLHQAMPFHEDVDREGVPL